MTKTPAASGAAAVAAPDETPGRPPAGTVPGAPAPPANPDAPTWSSRHPAGGRSPGPPAPPANPDAPVRVDVALPRDLFDRLTNHDDAPRCRYDAAAGRAEFVAEPTLSHESRAAAVGEFFVLVALALEDAGSPIGLQLARATRLLSADGAFEPDEGLFLGAGKLEAAERIDGWLDVRKGHPVPDLVVEIDRSTDSSGKLAPYFRMGVREAWTWSRRSGAAIWTADADAFEGFVRANASVVLPGVTRAALARLLATRSGADRRYHLRTLARLVARKMAERGDAEAAIAGRRT